MVDVPHSHGLLVLLIPTSDNEHKHWADAALQQSKAESLSVKVSIVSAYSRKDQGETPKSDNNRGNSLDWKSLGQNHSRIGTDNKSKVKNGGRHRIPITDRQV